MLALSVQKHLQNFTHGSRKIWLKLWNVWIRFFPWSVPSNSPAPTQDRPAPTQDHPAPTQDHPAPTQDRSAPTMDSPALGQDHAEPVTNHAESLEGLKPLASDDDDSPKAYAIELVRWLRIKGLTGGIDHRCIRREYELMCTQFDWPPRPWNPVARELTFLTTGKKVYRHITMQDGTYRRLRIYPIGSNMDKP